MLPNIEINKIQVPAFFYGTAWKEERTTELTLQALKNGFRAIDTANQRKHYFEAAVGEALAVCTVARDEIFLQTKYTYVRGQDHRLPYDPEAPYSEQVKQSFASSLEHLQTDYLDSYVLHGPSSQFEFTDVDWEVWEAMVELYQSGKVKLLGVSNMSYRHISHLLENAKVKPHFLQNRCYASSYWDRDIREICQNHGVRYQGFSLLTANRRELSSAKMQKICDDYNKTIAQIVFRFSYQLGMIPITGTTSVQHMSEDLAIHDFEISSDDMEVIENIIMCC